ncbi:MAG TPA: TPM domain-containing protein [Caulobacteraceae bacterium]|nr:TPM domain-containing protein [Caulobacteraceae bacterium]
MKLTALDNDRIEAAVAEAEEGSRGEIVCVLAGEVSHYREIPLAWGAAAALVVPPIAVLAGLHPLALASAGGAWTIGHASALEDQLALGVGAYALAQGLLFVLVALLASIPAVRRVLTPGALKAHRVRQAAQQQFAAISSRAVGSDTGILIFVALADRKVELLADAAIHDKVGAGLWREATAAIGTAMKSGDPTAGIVHAVKLCGDALRQHFPSEGPNVNVLTNRPLEL